MNKEHCLAFNKMVDCYLNNQINNLFDLEENMKALNNFQAKIDELQEMKDLAQSEHNGIRYEGKIWKTVDAEFDSSVL